MRVLTLDIGGANTKYALFLKGKLRKSRIIYNPVWKKSILAVLRKIKRETKPEVVAATFTAELSDVFEDKEKGVLHLTKACKNVFKDVYFLTVDKEIVRDANEPRKLAAANFVASIYYLEKKFDEGILLDMGSTTTDIVPFKRGKELYFKTDLERILNGQLVYIGFLRTPLNTIKNTIRFRNRDIRLAGEYFAITADLFRILGYKLRYTCETPDRKGKDRKSCLRRVARLLCSDVNEVESREILDVCVQIKEEILDSISNPLRNLSKKHGIEKAYIAGIGAEFLKEVCENVGMEYYVLDKKIAENLPCIGLHEIVKDEVL